VALWTKARRLSCDWLQERGSGAALVAQRKGRKDFVRRFPEIAKAMESLPEDTAIDGEIVGALTRRVNLHSLYFGSGAGVTPVVFYAFDPLMVRGRDLRFSHWRSDGSACAKS
jgi:hypothetical protein